MHNKSSHILQRGLLMLLLGISSILSRAQGVDFFSTEPEVFIQEFANVLRQAKSPRAADAVTVFESQWQSGAFSDEEKGQLITQINIMVSKRFRTDPDLVNYAWIYGHLRQGDAMVKIRPSQFLEVSFQAITELGTKRAMKLFAVLAQHVGEGYPVKLDNKFYWRLSGTTPEFMFLTLSDEKGEYKAPVLRYDNTDIQYVSYRHKDSTFIEGSQGDFHPLSMTFIGQKGRVNWSKVGLPADKVYCDFADFKLNLNYGVVKVDTATLVYEGLLNGPLIGRFEDANVGSKSTRNANYPYFKSHEGGVVIENFIPNVRYEGGFSLKGTRLIGTSYDIWVDYEPEESTGGSGDGWYSDYDTGTLASDETKDDEWEYDEWEDYTTEDASFESDDSDWESDESWSEDGSFGEEEEFYADESSLLPEQVREHVKAKLEIQRAGNTVMKLDGEAFILDQEKMVSKNNEATVYTSEEDSIYHPGMDILYRAADSTVTLKKPKVGTLKSIPFTSSYHEYFLYFETIIWDLGKDELQFTAFVDRENKVSAIESFDYFTKARFDQFKNILRFNPIGAIYRYYVLHKDDELSIFPEDVVSSIDAMGQLTAFERSLPGLEGSGFIVYDKKTKEITVLPKLINWARAARKKKDFDAVQIISKVDTGNHAIMDLENMNIEMRGVNYFSLSDSVYARVVPLEGKVSVQKGRNLQFGGVVASGKVNFYSSDEERPSFTFDYESYKIMCDSLDSIRFVLVRNPPPGYEPTPLELALSNTVFEGVTGAIHLDDPNNKSGEKNYSYFPVFDSYSQSYLYWDKPDIEKGVYKKDKMYYAVDPFVLDSLEDFDGTQLQFDGEFYSSEIFPKFRQPLQVMEDFTLGFKTETPPNGYRIYDGNGRFFQDVILDSDGLRGDGTIEYLGTVAKSDSFVFHFDSVMAEVDYFNLKRGYRGGVYFPQVDANSALYKWFTKDSALAVSSTYESLSVFGGEGEFQGTLSITEEGMVGDGEIILGQVRVRGDSIVFNEMDFMAEGCDFVLADEDDSTMVHFIAENVNITYDAWRHKSSFENPTPGENLATFPMHQYSTTLAQGEYVRATHDLKLQGASAYIKDNYFISVDPQQDSLNFTSKDAYYDLETREVEVNGVPYIYVADAIITPEESKVTVKEDGLIKTLEKAVIEADQESKMHRIYDARVDIFSRHEYEGAGKYDYIEINGKSQYIAFNNIKVSSDTTTIASGQITEPEGFYLTERIFFKGETQLDASRKFLSFGGEVKIESENPVFKGAWFNFATTIVDPDSVFIPIADDLTNDLGEELTVGLNYVPENRVFYSNFLQSKEDDDDIEVITASGGLTFDRRKKEFKIGSKEKLKNQVFKGSTVAFNDEKNTITSQGFLRFPYDFPDKTATIKMSGSWKEDLRRRRLETDLIMAVDFNVIPKEQLDKVAEGLSFLTAGNKDIDFKQYSFLSSVSELLDEGQKGERETAKFLENASTSLIYTDVKLANQLPYTILLSGVNFDYSRDYKALYSDAEVGLIGLGANPINKKVNAKIVYAFGTIGMDGEKEPDQVTIYLEVDEFNWMYFDFEGEVVKTISSYYDEYNYPLQEEVDKRKSDAGYRFEMATEDDRSRFLQDFVKKFIR